jgi:hypothetical protein
MISRLEKPRGHHDRCPLPIGQDRECCDEASLVSWRSISTSAATSVFGRVPVQEPARDHVVSSTTAELAQTRNSQAVTFWGSRPRRAP